ncbi:hypothetical protein SH661x_000014 [Planctomicrobium sp. SH661]|uniref:hypothetical protein n=1 Tax=Planctomicrobium sp. SH661 TaxID=3448124 RepID=UPI003F5BD723
MVEFFRSSDRVIFNRPLFEKLQTALKAVAYFLFALTFFDVLFLLLLPFPPDSWEHGLIASVFSISAAIYVAWKSLKQEKATRNRLHDNHSREAK